MNNQELDKKIGGRISEFRKRINLTQEVLAERVGCATVSISKLEVGKSRASIKMLAKIAESLNIPLMEIFRFNDLLDKERKIEGIVLLLRDENGRMMEKSYKMIEKHE
jgi:DNA-binding XRE family transcriptional regulator